jgi:hypothetical protein
MQVKVLPLYINANSNDYLSHTSFDSNEVAIFVRNSKFSLINSDNCWLKNKAWFWADKKAYQAYKKKLKDLQ